MEINWRVNFIWLSILIDVTQRDCSDSGLMIRHLITCSYWIYEKILNLIKFYRHFQISLVFPMLIDFLRFDFNFFFEFSAILIYQTGNIPSPFTKISLNPFFKGTFKWKSNLNWFFFLNSTLIFIRNLNQIFFNHCIQFLCSFQYFILLSISNMFSKFNKTFFLSIFYNWKI